MKDMIKCKECKYFMPPLKKSTVIRQGFTGDIWTSPVCTCGVNQSCPDKNENTRLGKRNFWHLRELVKNPKKEHLPEELFEI